jgi:hypothetical protein
MTPITQGEEELSLPPDKENNMEQLEQWQEAMICLALRNYSKKEEPHVGTRPLRDIMAKVHTGTAGTALGWALFCEITTQYDKTGVICDPHTALVRFYELAEALGVRGRFRRWSFTVWLTPLKFTLSNGWGKPILTARYDSRWLIRDKYGVVYGVKEGV